MIKEKVKSSLFLQLIGLAAGLILILCIGLLVTGLYIKDTLRSNTLNLNDKLMLQMERNLEEYYNSMRSIAMTVTYSPTVKDYYRQDEKGRIMEREEVAAVFSNALLLEESISGIYLYDMSMEKIAEVGKDIGDEGINAGISEDIRYGNAFYLNQLGIPYYLISFPVYDIEYTEYGKQIGTCLFLMKTDGLQKLLEDTQATPHTEVYLIDAKNQILGNISEQELTELPADMMRNSNTYQVRTSDVKMMGWRVVSRIPEDEMKQELKDNMKVTGNAYILAILLLLFLIDFCYFHILNRIHKVDRFISQIADEPELRMQEEGTDEIGKVVHNLNRMLDEREKMNQEILTSQTKMYEMEISKRQVQIMAHQNQINPHFLYNTFECIRSMALYYDVEDIAEITMALSNVFRFAVKAENIVTVEDEINYMREYAKIIDYRFMGKIEVHIDAEEEVLKKPVIKLMLQPLVENAVFHGLEQKIDEGEVDVSIRRTGVSHMLFVIEDNGCGIEPAKVVWLRNTLGTNLNRKGIGISNIYQRLKLFYEDDVKFEIKSKVGEGTRITIIIPDNVKEVGHRHA